MSLHLLDLTRPGAAPQPVAGADKGAMTRCSAPTARSGILAPVGEQDQLFRMAVGGKPVQVSNFKGDISGFKCQRRRQPRRSSGPTATCAAPTSPAPSCCPRPKPGGSGRVYDQMFVRHWDTWAEPGVRSPHLRLPDRQRQA